MRDLEEGAEVAAAGSTVTEKAVGGLRAVEVELAGLVARAG